MRRIAGALLLFVFLWPAVAHAQWREASSPNFVVYANDSERNIRRFSEQLELYHAAMEVLTNTRVPPPSPSNRLTVFVVKDQKEVRSLMGGGARYVAGYYRPRASGSIAVVPRIRIKRGETDFAMIVLLHEYAHHFLISGSALAMPRWLSEGGAEFFASAEFPSAGGISLGMPARHRAGELHHARPVKARELLDPAAYREGIRKGFDSFYGRSWLLYHYLTFNEERKGQLATYTRLLASGTDPAEAAGEAFGNFDLLDRELDRYLLQRRIFSFGFKPGQLGIGTIDVRQLDAGEAAVMPLVIRSRNGVTPEEAEKLVVEIREVAAAYPDNPAVLAALAEAEYDAGDDERAIDAADRALALDGTRRNAYVQKGYALFRQARDAEDADAAYTAAMVPFSALNRIENDHPLPLIYYYHSYAQRGLRPSDLSVRGMERAVELAPFDLGLRYTLATYHLQAGNLPSARYHLLPIAFNPHGGSSAEAARQVVERIEAGAEGDDAGRELTMLLNSRVEIEEEGEEEE